MLIDVDNVNQAESHKWVCHVLKTHMTHVLYPIFQEKSIGDGLRYVRGLQVMLIDVNNVNQATHVFDNFDELAVVLPLVVFVDVDDAKSG